MLSNPTRSLRTFAVLALMVTAQAGCATTDVQSQEAEQRDRGRPRVMYTETDDNRFVVELFDFGVHIDALDAYRLLVSKPYDTQPEAADGLRLMLGTGRVAEHYRIAQEDEGFVVLLQSPGQDVLARSPGFESFAEAEDHRLRIQRVIEELVENFAPYTPPVCDDNFVAETVVVTDSVFEFTDIRAVASSKGVAEFPVVALDESSHSSLSPTATVHLQDATARVCWVVEPGRAFDCMDEGARTADGCCLEGADVSLPIGLDAWATDDSQELKLRVELIDGVDCSHVRVSLRSR